MMDTAQRDGELIADAAAQGGRLGKPEVMGVRRSPLAYQARLGGDKFEVCAITVTSWLAEREYTLINWKVSEFITLG